MLIPGLEPSKDWFQGRRLALESQKHRRLVVIRLAHVMRYLKLVAIQFVDAINNYYTMNTHSEAYITVMGLLFIKVLSFHNWG